MDEIDNVDGYITHTIVVWEIEVSSHSMFSFVGSNVVEMPLESVHESVFSHSYILYVAFVASDAVDEVATFAIYPYF